MLKIRLRRIGARNKPSYQVVLCDSRISVRGKIIEKLGNYDPKVSPPLFKIKEDRVEYWVGKGAKISKRVESLLKKKSETIGGLDEISG